MFGIIEEHANYITNEMFVLHWLQESYNYLNIDG